MWSLPSGVSFPRIRHPLGCERGERRRGDRHCFHQTCGLDKDFDQMTEFFIHQLWIPEGLSDL